MTWWGLFKISIRSRCLKKSFNSTFIVLIPKKAGAEELKYFRPIYLIGGVYKIISKFITKKLKSVVGKLVHAHQMAFLKGRQITDASLLANELVDLGWSKRFQGFFANMTVIKPLIMAIGNLFKVLQDMRFGRKLITWLRFCIPSVEFSLIINGNNEGFLQCQRGLRQRDPLSSFLLILTFEGLNHMPGGQTQMVGWGISRLKLKALEIM